MPFTALHILILLYLSSVSLSLSISLSFFPSPYLSVLLSLTSSLLLSYSPSLSPSLISSLSFSHSFSLSLSQSLSLSLTLSPSLSHLTLFLFQASLTLRLLLLDCVLFSFPSLPLLQKTESLSTRISRQIRTYKNVIIRTMDMK